MYTKSLHIKIIKNNPKKKFIFKKKLLSPKITQKPVISKIFGKCHKKHQKTSDFGQPQKVNPGTPWLGIFRGQNRPPTGG